MLGYYKEAVDGQSCLLPFIIIIKTCKGLAVCLISNELDLIVAMSYLQISTVPSF